LFTVAGDAGSVLVHADYRRFNHLHGCTVACGQRSHKLIEFRSVPNVAGVLAVLSSVRRRTHKPIRTFL
jgi:hypothetical protein